MSKTMRYECLEPGCGWTVEAEGEKELVSRVQEHMGEQHDTFELEDVIIDAAHAAAEEGSRAAER